jgi:CheY-like chemotaxis protein
MNDQRPEDAIKLSALSQRSAMPWVCVADPRQQMRRFLAETLQDLGCVTCECADVAELGAELDLRPPVLVVIGLAAGGIEACEMVELLAAKEFDGKVLVLGPRVSPMVAAIRELGTRLGLATLPLLPTPFSQADLRNCIAAVLVPNDLPPIHSGSAADASPVNSLELWYEPKIDTGALALSGAEALVPIHHPTLGVVPPDMSCRAVIPPPVRYRSS